MMDEASEREAFEAGSKANGCGDDLRYKTSCDEYVNLMTHSAWQAWKGRAAVPVVQPPEFQEVSWGVDSTMRPCKGMAVSEYAFREWAKANGVALVAPMARQEPKTDSVYPVQPSTEAATARDAARYEQDLWLRQLFALIEKWRDTRDGTPSKAEAWSALWKHAHNLGPHWRAREFAALSSTPAQGDGGTAARSTSEGCCGTPDRCKGGVCPYGVKHIYQGGCPDETQPGASDPECPACSARGNVQRHITDMLVAHRDMIDAQQRGDSAAEVLAVQRMEAARAAIAASGVGVADSKTQAPKGPDHG
jgi:hypothetical protein